MRSVETLAEARRLIPEFLPDVIVAAVDAPGEDALAFVEEQAAAAERSVFALVSSDALELGVAAMERGARDFLWRPVSDARVAVLLIRLAARRERDSQAEDLRVRLVRAQVRGSLPGQSPRWHAAFTAIERAAAADEAVLLAGEAGTEQEDAARALHGLSSRGSGPFRKASSVDAPLSFGPGLRGTLFVPSLERRPLKAQQEILEWLDREGSLRPVLAVNEAPEEAMAAGRLLPELLEALSGRIVHLPPLRERGEDVDILARQFLAERHPALVFDAEALDALRAHDWPGNVRELSEVVRRAAGLSDGAVIGPTVVLSLLAGPHARRRARRKKPPVVKIAVGASLADVERRLIQKTLEFARGSKPKTAELLKLSLKTIYNKIKEYGLEH